ncbi:MAG: hypothetical protein KF878_26620 [Planctomycetes bacterium]|nr:hypothetical protein [Planctomycetota bacterium]
MKKVMDPAPPTLTRRQRLAVRAAFLAGGLVAFAVGLPALHVDAADLEARGGASDDVQRRRRHLVRRMREGGVRPADIGTTHELFKGEYAFGTYAMTGYALTNIALDAPETRAEALEVLDLLLDELMTPALAGFDAGQWGAPALATLDEDRGRVAYLGHLNLLLGARRLLGGDASRDDLHGRVTATLARRMRARPHRHVETYPRETYTMDNVVAVASLEVADRVRGTDHRPLIDEWVAYTRARLLDPTTGLIVFAVDEETGAPRQRGRGSAAGWASFFLPMFDLAFAREQWAAARVHLAGRLGPFAGLREYHPDDPNAGWGDIDSGPVLVWGVSATGFAIAGARRHGDRDLLAGQLALAELFGVSRDEGDERRYVAAPLLGEAILLCMKTARPWWDGMGQRRSP